MRFEEAPMLILKWVRTEAASLAAIDDHMTRNINTRTNYPPSEELDASSTRHGQACKFQVFLICSIR